MRWKLGRGLGLGVGLGHGLSRSFRRYRRRSPGKVQRLAFVQLDGLPFHEFLVHLLDVAGSVGEPQLQLLVDLDEVTGRDFEKFDLARLGAPVGNQYRGVTHHIAPLVTCHRENLNTAAPRNGCHALEPRECIMVLRQLQHLQLAEVYLPQLLIHPSISEHHSCRIEGAQQRAGDLGPDLNALALPDLMNA